MTKMLCGRAIACQIDSLLGSMWNPSETKLGHIFSDAPLGMLHGPPTARRG